MTNRVHTTHSAALPYCYIFSGNVQSVLEVDVLDTLEKTNLCNLVDKAIPYTNTGNQTKDAAVERQCSNISANKTALNILLLDR